MDPRTPVIVGVGLSDYPKAPHLSALGHVLQASHRALRDAGLKMSDVDGLICTGVQGQLLDDPASAAEFLNLRPIYLDGTNPGGSAAECVMPSAVNAIRSGAVDTILLAYGSDLVSNKALSLTTGIERGGRQAGPMMWDFIWGPTIISTYALIAQRHMHEFGTSRAHLTEVARSARLHAQRNPGATRKKPLSDEDVEASPILADPLRAIDCCLVNDAGGALILTTWERARDLPGAPIFILGSAMELTHWGVGQMWDMTTTGAASAGPRALAQAGRSHSEIDVLQVYDSFTITPLLMIEGLGFCGRGEVGPYISDGKLRPDGVLPMNTDGGGLANSHPGMRGIFLLIESVIQLRGEGGERQIDGAQTALACGSGGNMSGIGVVVLGKDPQ